MPQKQFGRLIFRVVAHQAGTLASIGAFIGLGILLAGVFVGLYNASQNEESPVSWGMLFITLIVCVMGAVGALALKVETVGRQSPVMGAVLCGLAGGIGFILPRDLIVYWLPSGILLLLSSLLALVSVIRLAVTRQSSDDDREALGKLATSQRADRLTLIARFCALGAMVLTVILMARNPTKGNFSLDFLAREWTTLFFGNWFPLLVALVCSFAGAWLVRRPADASGAIFMIIAITAYIYLPTETMILNWLPAIILLVIAAALGLTANDIYQWHKTGQQKAQSLQPESVS